MDTAHQHDQFVERFVRSQNRIYAYVATLLPNRADAEEVFQQTSLLLWKKWQQFDPARDFVAWACGMAHHEVRNFLRKHRDRGRVYLSDEVLAEVAQARLELHDVLESRQQALRRCLDQLAPEMRTLLERCYAANASIKAVAASLGKQPNMLYMTLKRLRRILFDCINRTLKAEGVA
jgi:RNA polymerase sigma-70 factor (ECF subfamily)